MSREGVRQIENKLRNKLASFSEKGVAGIRRKTKATKTLRILREKAARLTKEQIDFLRTDLEPIQLAVLERRALSKDPEPIHSIVGELSVSRTKIWNCEHQLILKLGRVLNEGPILIPIGKRSPKNPGKTRLRIFALCNSLKERRKFSQAKRELRALGEDLLEDLYRVNRLSMAGLSAKYGLSAADLNFLAKEMIERLETYAKREGIELPSE